MKIKNTLLPIGLALIFLLAVLDFILGIFIQNKQDKTLRIARENETVSLLALREYRTCNSFVLDILRNANQHLPNFNELTPGDTVFFPNITKMELDIQVYNKPDTTISTPRRELRNGMRQAIITWIEGNAVYKTSADSIWHSLENNLIVKTGDTIKTSDGGLVEIALDNKSVVRLGQNSEFTIHFFNIPRKKEIQANFALLSGDIWISIDQFLEKNSLIYISLPDISLKLKDARFRASILPEGSNSVHVYEGNVDVRHKNSHGSNNSLVKQTEDGNWIQKVLAGNFLLVSPNTPKPSPEIIPQFDKADAWVAWNRHRDAIFTQR
ncbi:MAG: FecR domain-containing protein [Deferribacteres bacterium]|nr:FecR domain-containing protein [candidate division KSB1 bacterium]MCB9502430.1 FecR domain-containing protein [Deferribacteres bacterium]